MTESKPNLKELSIRLDGIHILWEDGHQSYYEHRYLRSQCGCAHCVSEMTGQRLVVLADIRKDVEAVTKLLTAFIEDGASADLALV